MYSWWQDFEEGAEILYQIFGPGLLGSWAVGNLCKSEIAQKAISLHDLAGPKAQRMGGDSQVSNFLVSQNWPGRQIEEIHIFLNYTWLIDDKRPGKGKLASVFLENVGKQDTNCQNLQTTLKMDFVFKISEFSLITHFIENFLSKWQKTDFFSFYMYDMSYECAPLEYGLGRLLSILGWQNLFPRNRSNSPFPGTDSVV